MTDYVRAYRNSNDVYHREAVRLATNFPIDATIDHDGVIRWNSNGHVPPADCVDLAIHIGLPVSLAASTAARDKETAEFLAEYRKANTGRKLSAEERYEVRAAYGPGVKVRNVITGDTYES